MLSHAILHISAWSSRRLRAIVNNMVKEERFDFILKQLQKKKQLTYEWAASQLDVSEDTIRRDFDYLHQNGLLAKVRGGAMLRAKNPLAFQERTVYLKSEKDVIALKTQQFIKKGMTVFMDGGTTVCAVASAFPPETAIRVVTNNLSLVPILGNFSHIETIVLGGTYHRPTETATGITTCKQINEYIADIYIMGTCGIDYRFGISALFESDAAVKRSMVTNARISIALANHDTLRSQEPFKVCDLNIMRAIITDLPSDHAELSNFRNLDIQII